jgi:Allene oxide cyclase
MKRLGTIAGLVAALALAALPAWGCGGDDGVTIDVIEHATSDTPVDLPPEGDSLGDTLAFANDLFDPETGKKVGTNQGYCVRTVVGEAFECFGTTRLPQGSITVEGPYYDVGDSTLAITGGTHAYADARGTMQLKQLSPTEYEFVFELVG